MRDAADYVPGELEDGPCRFEDHQKARVSLEAFKARTTVARLHWEFDGHLYANCTRCGSSIAIEMPKETA